MVGLHGKVLVTVKVPCWLTERVTEVFTTCSPATHTALQRKNPAVETDFGRKIYFFSRVHESNRSPMSERHEKKKKKNGTDHRKNQQTWRKAKRRKLLPLYFQFLGNQSLQSQLID
ncbi:uncharacterized protein LOC122533338 [Frieseomelitta varia]|uniref:uncharacterized protein LOC122533338 n=1 Tax=Frieseomelitta varia TaxID=561572 RepID=UPI001CB68F21|nr:uncharacterized protein LOC122533338 [Frieseomelitta varia]